MQIQLHKILDVGMCYDILRSIRWDSGVKCTNCQSETVVKTVKLQRILMYNVTIAIAVRAILMI